MSAPVIQSSDAYVEAHRPEWIAACKRRMALIDSLPVNIRALIHEYGWEPVRLLMELGATKAPHIEHIIRSCRAMGQERRTP